MPAKNNVKLVFDYAQEAAGGPYTARTEIIEGPGCTHADAVIAINRVLEKLILWRGWPHLGTSALPIGGWTFWFDLVQPGVPPAHPAPRLQLPADAADAAAQAAQRRFVLRLAFQTAGDQLHFKFLVE